MKKRKRWIFKRFIVVFLVLFLMILLLLVDVLVKIIEEEIGNCIVVDDLEEIFWNE